MSSGAAEREELPFGGIGGTAFERQRTRDISRRGAATAVGQLGRRRADRNAQVRPTFEPQLGVFVLPDGERGRCTFRQDNLRSPAEPALAARQRS